MHRTPQQAVLWPVTWLSCDVRYRPSPGSGQALVPVAPITRAAMRQHCRHAVIGVLQVGQAGEPPRWGQISGVAGRLAADCVVWAARAALRGDVAALVTAPVHKEALAAAGVRYPGHTELLQAEAAAHLGGPSTSCRCA